jgi:hypothetical protein
MKNLFETKEWNRDNLRLICGDLYACMNGQQWVMIFDDVEDWFLACENTDLRLKRGRDKFSVRILDNRVVSVYKNYKKEGKISYDRMTERTYSKHYNDKNDVCIQAKDIAMMLNAVTKTKLGFPGDDIFSIPEAYRMLNTTVYDGILFINVSGNKWYPIAPEVACVYERDGGIAVVNNLGYDTKVIFPNKKERTLDMFELEDDGELNHIYAFNKEELERQVIGIQKYHSWKLLHDLFLSELNRDVFEVTLYAENRPYLSSNDDWGEPEKEETVEFNVESINIFDDGLCGELTPNGSGRKWWNKIRKDILGIKTPSERFEENMKDFKWCDEETLKKFDKNLRDAMRVKDDKKKTLNEIRKEHGFEDAVTRESTDNKPQTLREMVQPVLDELRDAERYSWQIYVDEMKAKLNHDVLKAHLNEKLVSDNVDSPNHYKLRGLDIEAIDVIRGALTEDEFRGFCKGNVLKYTIREGHKNGDEDLKKAKKYLEFLEEDDNDE